MSVEEWRNSLHRGDPWMRQQPDGAKVAQTSGDATRKPPAAVDVVREPRSGGGSTDVTSEPSMASPRLIPVFDSPDLPVQLTPEPEVGDTGRTSASFDRNCAPSRGPVSDIPNYDQPSSAQLHELCKQRGYYGKDTKAAPRIRLEVMDAVAEKTAEGSSGDMDTPMTGVAINMGAEAGGNNGKRWQLIWKWSRSMLNGGLRIFGPGWRVWRSVSLGCR